ARQAFVSKAKPVFDSVCVSCHAGSVANVGFLAGKDALSERATIMAFDPQVVNLEAPQSSRVLTKGPHSGPELLPQQLSDVLEWISAERDAVGTGGLGPELATARFTPLLCTSGNPGDPTCPINYVDLTGILQGWAGAQIKMVAQPLSQDLYVTNLA